MKKYLASALILVLCASLCACNMGGTFSNPFAPQGGAGDGENTKPTGNATVIVDPETGETTYVGESSTVIVNPDGSVQIGSGDDGSAIVIGPGSEEDEDFLVDEE